MGQEAATTDSPAIHDAIGRLYGAVMAPAEWTAALENVTGLLHADHSIIFALGPGGNDPFHAWSGLDPRHAARFATADAMRMGEPLLRLVPVDRAVSTADIVADRDLERTAYYNELIRPTKTFYALAASIEVPGRAGTFMSFCRTRRAGAFDAAGAATLQAILPHFAAALEFTERLQSIQQQNDGLLRLLDQLESGVILVDAAGKPCFVNRRAMRILTEADGLMLGPSGLLAATAAATQRLRRAIAGMSPPQVSPALEGQPTRLSLPRHSLRPPLLLSLYPIWRLADGIASIPRPRVGIFVSEPDLRLPVDCAALAEAFGLTPREAAVAGLLADGHDLKGAARALAIGVGTARNHLKRVLDKTDTHSQVALMAVLRGFVRPAG